MALPVQVADRVESKREAVHEYGQQTESRVTKYALLALFYLGTAVTGMGLLILAVSYVLANRHR
jgi:hypothetical protein